jgi:hypothetical protein
MVCREQDEGGHANGQAAVVVVAAQPDFKGPDVALGAADVPLGGVLGVRPAIKNDALARGAGRQADGELVAKTDAVNITFLDVGPHPEVFGIDERDNGLAGVDHLALQGGADVHGAVDGRVDVGVAQNNGGLFLLGGGGGALLDGRLEGGAAGGDLFAGGFGQGHRGLRRHRLFAQRLNAGFGRVAARSRLVVFLHRINTLLVEGLFALESEAEIFQIGFGLDDLVLGRGQIRFTLPGEVAGLRLLELQIGLALRDLGGGLFRAAGVEGQIGLPFGGLNPGEQLSVGHGVAFVDQKFLQPALNLRTGDDFIGGDHAGQDDFAPAPDGDKIKDGSQNNRDDNNQRNLALHMPQQIGWAAARGQG